MKVIRVVLPWVLVLLGAVLFAQTKKVVGTGRCELTHITPEKATAIATEAARINALEAAGVPIKISSIESSVVSNLVNTYVRYVNSEIMGDIVDEQRQAKKLVENDRFYIEIILHATVKLGAVAHDPAFEAAISGFGKTYKEGDKLQFRIKPTKDCYVQIFWFDEVGNGGKLYPNEDEQPELLKASTTYSFPRHPMFDYTLTKETRELAESNSYVFVFTKDERPYTRVGAQGATSLDDLYQWIIKIPSERRLTKKEVIVVGLR